MQIIYLAMARGILMGKSDCLRDFDAMLPEVTDWVSAVNDPAIVLKLAKKLEAAQVPPPPKIIAAEPAASGKVNFPSKG